ncbi:hypothetical protein GUA87_04985 [Sneathiella sp. P13V-1]|uniref:hypothetical protein n=1 Tax=Sneathiella sp. P13V-1 TaxID=2697366 RepID=UPI00187B22CA|nr:hypothetical protein [Sneathiella sp. P13V-1]MBE7636188.1 hypothetical protein [Sneathiella sp. P13V-1]
MKKYLTLLLACLMIETLSLSLAFADDNTADYSSVSVRNAKIVESQETGRWRLMATFQNESQSNLVLLGFLVAEEEHSLPFKIKVGENDYRNIQSLSLSPEEVLDLSTSHVVAEFDRALDVHGAIGTVKAVLHTSHGYVPFWAHKIIN